MSAVLLAAYLVTLLIFFSQHPGVTYSQWLLFMGHLGMRLWTMVALISLLAHAWIGLWTVFGDYVKCAFLRVLCNIALALVLIAALLWGFMILWGV